MTSRVEHFADFVNPPGALDRSGTDISQDMSQLLRDTHIRLFELSQMSAFAMYDSMIRLQPSHSANPFASVASARCRRREIRFQKTACRFYIGAPFSTLVSAVVVGSGHAHFSNALIGPQDRILRLPYHSGQVPVFSKTAAGQCAPTSPCI